MRINYFISIGAVLFSLFLFSCCDKDDKGDDNPNLPFISGISPTSGTKGTIVSIIGTGFSNNIQDVVVFLDGNQMLVTLATETLIKFSVPPKAGSGLVSIVIKGNGVSGPMFNFIYTVTITTFSGQPGVPGFADGGSSTAKFNFPRGLTLDAQENIYVADEKNNRIRKVSASGTVITFAGLGIAGHQDGNASVARFNSPHDIDLDLINGFFYVADKLNHCVRRITFSGNVTTAAGIPGNPGYVDAPGLSARLNKPTGVAVEGEMVNVYIADGENHCIRKLDQFEVVSTFAGSTIEGQQDGIGNSAKFSLPYDVAWDSSGFLFVTDQVNQNIRRIDKSNIDVITIAGSGLAGYNDGIGATATFNAPAGVCSWFNQVIVGDNLNNRIRNISPSKIVTTMAGEGTAAHLDGPALQSKFNRPGGIVRNSVGDYFVSDTENHCIRKMVVD